MGQGQDSEVAVGLWDPGQRGGSGQGADVGVGMLRGAGDSLT